ncbi:hypothetical protein QBC34DRAFT_384225 [Podospora aff. communis PSN243]|uniref:ZZ-type domain-containing protein n=1 Tax=Podospora aff. communis PSN243 TaxID=3040156 RepID=A0AAV9GB60_9PEZI|nr:hypothetical protein QBC34DRAFT_384225 [Podospora aff. communis PSN243]
MAGIAARFMGQNEPGLYLVHPQDPERERACTCDIFIVHGLRGGATSSWQHPESGTIWFQHLLPESIRNQTNTDSARIWTFGYDAGVAFQAATIYEQSVALLNRVKDVRKGFENRKIIWVCHSLGGIIVKHALVDAALNARYRAIYTGTGGIVFLSTPHQGSGFANFANVIAGVINAVTPGFRVFQRNNFRDLERDSSALFEISSKFSNICTNITIHTFYESGGAHVIVNNTSAVLNLPNEVIRHPLRVSHREMGKFHNATDQNWLTVSSSIVELVLLTTWSARPPPNTAQQANTSRPFDGYPPDPAPEISMPKWSPPSQEPPPVRHSRQSSTQGQARDNSPRPSSMNSGPPSSANVQERMSRSSLYPPLNQSQSRLNLRQESGARTAPTPSSRSPSASPGPSRASPPQPEPVDPSDTVANCDGCGRSIGGAERRVQCTVCYDYDLCTGCFQDSKTSKSHSSDHKVSHLLNTLHLRPDDLVPVHDAVNPPTNLIKGRKNWTLEQIPPHTTDNPTELTATLRRLHLFDDNSHARFRAHARPGHYALCIEIGMRFDPGLEKNAVARQQLLCRTGGVGKLRVTMGVFRDNKQFTLTRFAEDSFSDTSLPPNCLPEKLFRPGYRGSVATINLGAESCVLGTTSLLHVSGAEGSVAGIGLIVQWSGVAAYEQSATPIVSITVKNVYMHNVLDYNEPYIRAPPPQPQPQPPQTRPITPTPTPKSGGYDNKDIAAVEDFVAALLQIQRAALNAQEKARREALLRQRLAQQEQAKREAVARLYLQAMAEAIREAEEDEFLRALGLR